MLGSASAQRIILIIIRSRLALSLAFGESGWIKSRAKIVIFRVPTNWFASRAKSEPKLLAGIHCWTIRSAHAAPHPDSVESVWHCMLESISQFRLCAKRHCAAHTRTRCGHCRKFFSAIFPGPVWHFPNEQRSYGHTMRAMRPTPTRPSP